MTGAGSMCSIGLGQSALLRSTARLCFCFSCIISKHISAIKSPRLRGGDAFGDAGDFADGWEKRVTGACADVDCDDPVVPGEFYGDLPRDGASGRARGTGKGSEESGEIGLGARHIRCASVLSELLAAGAWPFMDDLCRVLFCLDRFIGMGNINGIEGESAWIYLAVGFSILIGSAAWAVCDALELHRGVRKEARAYAYASQSR